jgi:hypothetical protein
MAYIPDGIRVPTHEAASSRGWGLGADEDGNRTREREWGKKIERRMEEERVDCYIKDKGANLVGALCVLQGTREDGVLPMGPEHDVKGAKTNGAL